MESDAVEIRIKLSKIWLERAIFIVIILILLFLVFYNPLGKYRGEKSLSQITSTGELNTQEENKTTEPVIEEEPIIEQEPAPEPKAEETEQKLSGKATIQIGEIVLDENKTKVQSISLSIDNQKKIFNPLLYVYWYDESTEDAVKAQPNGGKINFTGPIPLGKVTTKKLDDELKNRRLRIDDKTTEIFKIELYDLSDPVVALDTKTKTINTD